MIDALSTLGPAAGLARACHTIAPEELPLWTVAVDVGLSEIRGGDAAEPELRWVGGSGFTRSDAIVRAAGEAVERYALVPRGVDTLQAAVAPEARIRVARHGRAAAGLDAAAADCLPAVVLPSGRECLVPAVLVDDPADSPWVDASPSGAAAGPSWEFAATRALLESVERDAVQRGWVMRPAVQRVDPLEVASERLAEALEGVAAAAVLLPTGVPGLTCASTFLLEPRAGGGRILSAGARATWSAREAVLGSLREAVQVLQLLRGIAGGYDPLGEDALVTAEPVRARYCLSERPAAWVDGWLARCVPGTLEPDADPPADELGHVATALAGAGLEPVVCDLTHRLPEAIQALGWHAVRAIVLGHQPLRMDERHTWSWVLDDPAVATAPPHPYV